MRDIVGDIREMRSRGLTIREISKTANKTPQTVHKIIMTADIHFNSEEVKKERRDSKLNKLLNDSN